MSPPAYGVYVESIHPIDEKEQNSRLVNLRRDRCPESDVSVARLHTPSLKSSYIAKMTITEDRETGKNTILSFLQTLH